MQGVAKYLVVKCYFATKKLAWEIRQEQSALKKKMEIKWASISAIRARNGKNAAGILEIEVSFSILIS